MIEWFCICWRHGWLPNTKDRNPHQVEDFGLQALDRVNELNDERRKLGLHRPYGTAAERRAARRRE